MTDQASSERSIFEAAIEMGSPSERAAYVDEVCGSDLALRQEVEALLAAHDRLGSMASFATGCAATTDVSLGESPGTMIGPYKLLEKIGEGGMGLVFVADQQEPIKRRVALKVIKPGMDSKQVIARFEAERQALARMDHSNIAKVLDAGTTDSGRPYFVMEFVKGAPITEFCDQHKLATRQRLELFVSVCQAVQHAHQKGIIHRDIKPSNVMIASHDGTPVVKVIDFGVAKAVGQQLTDKTVYTAFVQLIGTPLYMSPEQAGLSSLDVDTRSDIYSLGVLLYELLTGTTPFDAETLKKADYDELRRIIREDEPPRPSTRLSTLGKGQLATVAERHGVEPRRLNQQVRGELDWIVMKALEKDRARRYESSSALAADVQRYLHDEPVQACPPSAWYRFGKFARRNKAALATAAAVVLVVFLAVALIWRANQELQESVNREQREAYFQRIAVAHREVSTGNVAAALRALEDCPAALRGWEWNYLKRLCKVEPLVLQDSTAIYGVAFSADGARIASAGKDGKVKIWNSRTGKLILKFAAHDKAACSVVFHSDGRHLASAGADGLVKVWDVTADSAAAVFEGRCDALRKFGAAYTVAFSPPDGRLLAAGADGAVRIWNWKKNQPQAPEHTFPGPEHHSIPVMFTRDGRRLATRGPSQQGLSLWDVEAGQPVRSLPADPHPVTALAFSADGVLLAAASTGRTVSVWNTATGKLHTTLPHDGNVLAVSFSLDGRRLASAGEDKTVHVWDAVTGREVLGLHGHNDMCGCVAFSPDGWRLASASHDGTIRIWDATPLRGDEGQGLLTFSKHDHEIRSVAVSPDGRWVASAGNGALVKVWDAATGQVRFEFPGHSVLVFAVAWDPDGRRIATAGSVGREHAVKVWDPWDGRLHFKIGVGRDSSAGPYQVVAFSPDRRYLVTGQLEGAVQVWDARTGAPVRTLGAHDREIRAVVFSPDGKQLATASGDGIVKLWDAERLDEKQDARLTLPARVPGPSVNVAFSPDGRRLATGGDGNTVKIWNVEKGGEHLMTLRGHRREVYAVAFSPNDNGRWLASGGEDSKVKIWDSRSGEVVMTFWGHTGLISSLAFSPDGKRLYSGSRDTTVKVWDLTPLSRVRER